MGRIVFASPTIDRFHLHEVLARRLLRQGHEVEVWASDPVTARFYRAQGLQTKTMPRRQATVELRGLPLEELGARHCALRPGKKVGSGAASRPAAEVPGPRSAERQRAIHEVGSFVPGLLREFSTRPPDVVFFHEGRSALQRLIHYFATEFGCGTLHTGPGLLPGTMQWDRQGIDGDSSKMLRTKTDYARHPRDEMVLMAALAAVLGGQEAGNGSAPLEPAAVNKPSFASRVSGVLHALRRKQYGPAWHGLSAWRRAVDQGTFAGQVRGELPTGPFITVLLQDPDSAAVRLDTRDPDALGDGWTPRAPSHDDLIIAARRAAWAIDSTLPIVVIPPQPSRPGSGFGPADEHRIRSRVFGASAANDPARSDHELRFCADADRMTALTTALAVVTINHPHGLVATLAGTPLIHLGRALYGGAEVATASTLDRLPADLQTAVQSQNPPHRASYLTRTLVYDHVWCDAEHPDQNGMKGLVGTLEEEISSNTSGGATGGGRMEYQPGPSWMGT